MSGCPSASLLPPLNWELLINQPLSQEQEATFNPGLSHLILNRTNNIAVGP